MHIKCPNRDDFIFIRCIVHVPLVYGQKPYGTCTRVIPLYHYNFTHTYTVVVYAYHMRMTAKAVNTLELVRNCINAADSYNRTQSCKSQSYEVQFYTRSYKTQLHTATGFAKCGNVTHVTRQTNNCTSCPHYILRMLQHTISIFTQPHLYFYKTR